MNDAELIAALRADRRLNHYQVTTLWAVVARLGGEARCRATQSELAEDLRIDRKTVSRALSTLPEGLPLRVEVERGTSMLFVVDARVQEASDADFASDGAETPVPESPNAPRRWDSEVQPDPPAGAEPVPESPNAPRRWDSEVQPDPPAGAEPVPPRYRLGPPPVPDSPNAPRRWDSGVQVTGVHTPTLSAIRGGRGGSDLQGSPNRLGIQKKYIHSDAGARARAGAAEPTGIFCADGSEAATTLRLRAQRAAADPVVTSLEYGPPSTWPEVVTLAKRFQELWGREVRLTAGSPGVRRVLDRLAEGYTVEELAQALQGSKNDPFYQANAQFQTLHTILRDSGQVDRFMAIAEEPPTRGITGKAIQPNHASIDPLKNAVIVEG